MIVRGFFGRRVTLDHATLLSFLSYSKKTGIFRWRVNRYRVLKGDIAGWKGAPYGHRYIRLLQQTYSAHQLAWFYVTGKFPIFALDHKNRIPDDNRWRNIRRAGPSLNGANRGMNKNNKSGYKGVSLHNPSGRWVAQIMKDQKQHNLGLFDTPKEAHVAYMKAARTMFGQFARAR